MRALLVGAIVALCACGALGARRRFDGAPPRPFQRRPFGWREFQANERRDFRPQPLPLETQERPRLVLQERFDPAPQEPFRPPPQLQEPAGDSWPVRNPAAQERQDFAPERLETERADAAPSFSEPEVAADSPQEQYAITIPEKTEKNRLEFQVHGQQGPHSYRFGYDTGTGYNRQFRFEERDDKGNLKGRYGFYDKSGKLQVVNYSATHEGGFHAEGDFGAFPGKNH